MDLDDPQDTYDTVRELKEEEAEERAERKRTAKLKNVVALTIALLATFAGLCKVKAENVAQAMQKTESERVNQYSWYQARNIRQEILSASAAQMRAGAAGVSPASRASWDKQAAAFEALAKEQETKKEGQLKDAKAADERYEALNVHDDQFDASDAFFSVAITLLALSALTESWALYCVALFPMAAGFVMGLAGLLNWGLKLDFLSKLLGA